MGKNEKLCMSFIDCYKKVKANGLHMIRPSEDVPGQYDLCNPFEGGEDWIWLDAFTANVVCQVYEALSAETQEKFKKDSAEHGEIGGIPDAIGYECPAHAQKFRTEDEALHFIHTELPEWGRALHRPAALGFADFTWDALGLAALLWQGKPVPDSMLGPAVGRLRLWRR